MEERVRDGAAETASICNIIHLLHSVLITGVFGVFTKRRFFSMQGVPLGSAKRSVVCLGAQDIPQLQIFRVFMIFQFTKCGQMAVFYSRVVENIVCSKVPLVLSTAKQLQRISSVNIIRLI